MFWNVNVHETLKHESLFSIIDSFLFLCKNLTEQKYSPEIVFPCRLGNTLSLITRFCNLQRASGRDGTARTITAAGKNTLTRVPRTQSSELPCGESPLRRWGFTRGIVGSLLYSFIFSEAPRTTSSHFSPEREQPVITPCDS